MVIRAALSVVLLAATSFAEKIEVDMAGEALVKARLEAGLVPSKERQSTIAGMFRELGCTVEEQKVDRKAGNVICTLPGETDSTIIVGGHFDFIERGKGIVDDWSGVALLPSLYQALKSRPHQHTYVFIAFASEEPGLFGSARYVKMLTREQKDRIDGFVNLECLGLAPAVVWQSRADSVLIKHLLAIAEALKFDLRGVNVEKIGDDDAHSFRSAHIPAITVHSVTQETFRLLHTDRDRLDAVHFDDYYSAYKLVAYYLSYLDVKTGHHMAASEPASANQAPW